jgi:hypothetical protein
MRRSAPSADTQERPTVDTRKPGMGADAEGFDGGEGAAIPPP